jgi:HEAT repeat protein
MLKYGGMSENLSQHLSRKLKSPTYNVKKAALFSIVEHNLKDLGDDILRLLGKEKDSDIKGRCAWALGRLHYHEAFNVLVKGLYSKERDVRIWSAWALGELGNERARVPLTRALNRETESKVRRSIGGALKKLALQPTRVHVSQLNKRLKPPKSEDSFIISIVRKLETLEWQQNKEEVLALRQQILDRDPEYCMAYMEWLKIKPAVQDAITNRKKVYSD